MRQRWLWRLVRNVRCRDGVHSREHLRTTEVRRRQLRGALSGGCALSKRQYVCGLDGLQLLPGLRGATLRGKRVQWQLQLSRLVVRTVHAELRGAFVRGRRMRWIVWKLCDWHGVQRKWPVRRRDRDVRQRDVVRRVHAHGQLRLVRRDGTLLVGHDGWTRRDNVRERLGLASDRVRRHDVYLRGTSLRNQQLRRGLVRIVPNRPSLQRERTVWYDDDESVLDRGFVRNVYAPHVVRLVWCHGAVLDRIVGRARRDDVREWMGVAAVRVRWNDVQLRRPQLRNEQLRHRIVRDVRDGSNVQWRRVHGRDDLQLHRAHVRAQQLWRGLVRDVCNGTDMQWGDVHGWRIVHFRGELPECDADHADVVRPSGAFHRSYDSQYLYVAHHFVSLHRELEHGMHLLEGFSRSRGQPQLHGVSRHGTLLECRCARHRDDGLFCARVLSATATPWRCAT